MSSVLDQIRAAEAAKRQAISVLHVELGYALAKELADAILSAAKSGGVPNSGTTKAASRKKGGGRGRRVPDSVRTAIVAALKAGETASHLPEKFGVSYNVVHALKKEIGMVTSRGRVKRH
jgi:hypothetical protein